MDACNLSSVFPLEGWKQNRSLLGHRAAAADSDFQETMKTYQTRSSRFSARCPMVAVLPALRVLAKEKGTKI